jgi:Flp pilus assembly protein TadG
MQRRDRVHRRNDERGAALVEFAIVLPLLVMFLMGIVQFSLTYHRQQALHAAAREGGRVAALPTATQSDITAAVDGALDGTSLDGERVITITPNLTQPCLDNQGATVTVVVQSASGIDIPLWASTSVDLTGKAAFRCE